MSEHQLSDATGQPAALTGPGAEPAPAIAAPAAPDRLTRLLAWSSAIGIGSSIATMIVASVTRNGWSTPHAPLPATGPPWGYSPQLSLTAMTMVLWAAGIAGGAGVAAGLAAVARGARPPVRLLIAAALVTVAVLTVLPPTGSGDALNYAIYGRITVLGHSPYVMTPADLARTGDPVARAASIYWRNNVSVYGPAATVEQWTAARLGGTSTMRIDFWLKLWDSLGFCVVLLALDRLLRANPARRARAHLLWSVNPLLLWGLVAAGHIDLMPAAAGLLGLVVLGRSADRPPPLLRAAAAGLLVGLAADFKVTYLLFAAGIAWALRRWPTALATAAAGALAVLVPSYLWFGAASVTAPLDRGDQAGRTGFYRFLHIPQRPGVIVLALSVALFLAVAALLLRNLPDGTPARPAIMPALALSIAWLFTWNYQLPWYDTMAICLLALYPASWLDWLVLARLGVGTVSQVPGTDYALQHMSYLAVVYNSMQLIATPVVELAALAGLIWLCRTRAWHMDPPLAGYP